MNIQGLLSIPNTENKKEDYAFNHLIIQYKLKTKSSYSTTGLYTNIHEVVPNIQFPTSMVHIKILLVSTDLSQKRLILIQKTVSNNTQNFVLSFKSFKCLHSCNIFRPVDPCPNSYFHTYFIKFISGQRIPLDSHYPSDMETKKDHASRF